MPRVPRRMARPRHSMNDGSTKCGWFKIPNRLGDKCSDYRTRTGFSFSLSLSPLDDGDHDPEANEWLTSLQNDGMIGGLSSQSDKHGRLLVPQHLAPI
jgi:hypothetical protein